MAIAPLFIIGMHRSGTSLLAQISQQLGYFMGEERDRNQETRLFIRCNEALLKRAGAGWDHPRTLRKALQVPGAVEAYAEYLEQLLDSLQKETICFLGETHVACRHIRYLPIPWGAKDPRLTFTLPIWKYLFPHIKVLHITRNGTDVARSLATRQQQVLQHICRKFNLIHTPPELRFRTGIVDHTMRCMGEEGALALWREYREEAEYQMQAMGKNGFTLSYEALLGEPEKVLRKLAGFLDIEPSEIQKREIIAGICMSDLNLKRKVL